MEIKMLKYKQMIGRSTQFRLTKSGSIFSCNFTPQFKLCKNKIYEIIEKICLGLYAPFYDP